MIVQGQTVQCVPGWHTKSDAENVSRMLQGQTVSLYVPGWHTTSDAGNVSRMWYGAVTDERCFTALAAAIYGFQ